MSRIVIVPDGDDGMQFAEEMAQGVAGANVKPWQRELRKGDCFVYFAEGLAVYSEAISDNIGDYLPTRSYSVACDMGEMGDVHISEIFQKITREQFKAFKAKEWPAHEAAVRALLQSN